jgi:Na+/phosphate symporter
VSDTVIIVNAVFAFLGTVFTGVMAYLLTRLNQKQAIAAVETQKVAVAAKEVKETLADTTSVVVGKLDAVAQKVEEVHLATNSLTDRLVETTRSDAHAAGLKEGQERGKS